MPVPTTYTEDGLATFMRTVLGPIGRALGWVEPGAFSEIVIETLSAYGVTSIDTATDINKLRSLARREAWRAAVEALASAYNFSADGQSFTRSQMQTQAKVALNIAESRASSYDQDYAIGVDKSRQIVDPYVYMPDDLRR